MSKTITTYVLMTFAIATAGIVHGDDAATNALEHPVDAYHQQEVKSDSTKTQELTQQQAEAKARMDQAKADYEKSLAANGADNDVTKAAKKRFADARKDYHKYAKKASQAGTDLQNDTQKVNQDKSATQ